MKLPSKRIAMYLSAEEYEDVSYIAKSVNLTSGEFAKLALRQFLLNLRIANIKLYLTVLDDQRQRDALRMFAKDNDISLAESTFALKADADRFEDRLLETGYDDYQDRESKPKRFLEAESIVDKQ